MMSRGLTLKRSCRRLAARRESLEANERASPNFYGKTRGRFASSSASVMRSRPIERAAFFTAVT